MLKAKIELFNTHHLTCKSRYLNYFGKPINYVSPIERQNKTK
jgi:hypothetical protein